MIRIYILVTDRTYKILRKQLIAIIIFFPLSPYPLHITNPQIRNPSFISQVSLYKNNGGKGFNGIQEPR